ncbi:hypothetical protein BDD12DRAFT_810522 [Trichophaea hybrida]|nr:hypothetical protein BDD12DRAFT_810522 [Trichophaea hybrida]
MERGITIEKAIEHYLATKSIEITSVAKTATPKMYEQFGSMTWISASEMGKFLLQLLHHIQLQNWTKMIYQNVFDLIEIGEISAENSRTSRSTSIREFKKTKSTTFVTISDKEEIGTAYEETEEEVVYSTGEILNEKAIQLEVVPALLPNKQIVSVSILPTAEATALFSSIDNIHLNTIEIMVMDNKISLEDAILIEVVPTWNQTS